MTPGLKLFVLCSCFCLSTVLASAQATTCATDGDSVQAPALGCVTGEGVVVKAAPDATQTADGLPLTPEQRPATAPVVIFEHGKLSITANNANLGDILRVVGEKTGASIDIPESADERVVSALGPGAAREVIAALLNGSHFNYVVLGNETDPDAVARVVLTAKSDHADTGKNSPADAALAAAHARQMIQPRTALQQALAQPSQEMQLQQAAQPATVPDFQAQPQTPSAPEAASTPSGQASVSGEAAASPSGGPGNTETAAAADPASASDVSKNGDRTPQQMLQDLYETRRQMIQQQTQQRVAQQQPPQ